jgi:hypothetical protein
MAVRDSTAKFRTATFYKILLDATNESGEEDLMGCSRDKKGHDKRPTNDADTMHIRVNGVNELVHVEHAVGGGGVVNQWRYRRRGQPYLCVQ